MATGLTPAQIDLLRPYSLGAADRFQRLLNEPTDPTIRNQEIPFLAGRIFHWLSQSVPTALNDLRNTYMDLIVIRRGTAPTVETVCELAREVLDRGIPAPTNASDFPPDALDALLAARSRRTDAPDSSSADEFSDKTNTPPPSPEKPKRLQLADED
ncbi:MAG: hypothetical protein RL235_790 [Chlamydiota bacterium]|jgi:hypothetical protein